MLHVQGYDPHGVAEYHERFEREHRRTCELYGLTGEVGAPKETRDGLSASWDVSTKGDSWQVATRYTLLRWDDLVRKDMERAPWWKIVQMYRTVGVSILNGAFGRMLRANWRYALVAIAPILLITVWVLLGSFVGILCMNLVAALGAPEIVARTVGLITGFGAFASILWLTEPITGLLLRCDEVGSIDQFVGGKRPDWSERLDAFARDVVDAAQEPKSDELIVVGHGFGAVLAINVLGRALSRDGALGRARRARRAADARRQPAGGRLQPGSQGLPQPAAAARDRLGRRLDRCAVARRHSELRPVRSHRRSRHRARRAAAQSAGDDGSLFAICGLAALGLRRLRVSQAHAQYLMANERRGCALRLHLDLLWTARSGRPRRLAAAGGGRVGRPI